MGDQPLPVSLEIVERRISRQSGPWVDVLGPDEKGYCHLTRLVTVNSAFRCLSRIYLSASRFGKIIKLAQSNISGNIKRVLAEEFDTPTIALDQYILPCALDDDVSAQLELPRASTGMVVNTIGLSVGREPISFQSLWVPSGGYLLEISAAKQAPRPNVRV